jgi:peptidoglycan/xylan/chitin deacetylase (PgdA/CDA1 family)
MRQTLDWPADARFYLTLDFECDFGTALAENTYQAIEAVDQLIELLRQYSVPLTCFVQTELLDEKPGAVDALQSASFPVQFHPHSHTHRPRDRTSITEEIAQSTNRFREFFGSDPVGYRFPNGNVRKKDYRILAEHGYEFNASLFPSWRPNHFDNSAAPTVPQYFDGLDIFEIPFTVYSDRIRIPTALSYNRLLRRPFGWLLRERPPPVVIYNIHMHDLVTPESFADLPRPYRLLYGQNDRGFELLERTLDAFVSKEYEVGLIDDVHDSLRASLQ